MMVPLSETAAARVPVDASIMNERSHELLGRTGTGAPPEASRGHEHASRSSPQAPSMLPSMLPS